LTKQGFPLKCDRLRNPSPYNVEAVSIKSMLAGGRQAQGPCVWLILLAFIAFKRHAEEV